MYFTSKVYEGFKLKQSTVAALIDCQAVFDRIPHSTIILQAMKIGIRGEMLQFIVSYIQNHLIEVSVNDALSSGHKLYSGRETVRRSNLPNTF